MGRSVFDNGAMDYEPKGVTEMNASSQDEVN